VTGDPYLSGLVNINISNLNLVAEDLIDITDSLNDNQISLLVQALTSDSTATQNADKIASELSSASKLPADETVIGRSKEGKIYTIKKDKLAKIKKEIAQKPLKGKGKAKGRTSM
jgi:hypothetical protein